jgi:SnoaL-like domain
MSELPSLTTMPDEATPESAPDVVSRYFEADARRDIEAVLSLFREDAVVTDESREWRGLAEIRQWRLGPVSKYEYTTTIARIDHSDESHYRVSGHIDGNFPGGTAELEWDFSIVGGLISRLEIAPP